MPKKLNDYCKENHISYNTGYRWFKSGKLPYPAYQTKTGTIIVDDDVKINAPTNYDSISWFMKKVVQFSNSKATIEEFAAWILSNFTVKLNCDIEDQKYSKVKQSSEDIQNHFKQFIPNKDAQEKLKQINDVLKKNIISNETEDKNFIYDPEYLNGYFGARYGLPIVEQENLNNDEKSEDNSNAGIKYGYPLIENIVGARYGIIFYKDKG